jgi:hypothetical protein
MTAFNKEKATGRPLLGLLVVVAALAIGYWLSQSSGPERIVETQHWVTDRLMLMQSDDFDINEARLRDLIDRSHERIGSPDGEGDFEEQAYGANLIRAMSQIALDDRDPALSSRCSVVMIEFAQGIGR